MALDITSYLLGKESGGSGPTPTYQSKDISITENGTTTITPDTGYDALSEVDVTTNIQPDLESKTITITENTTTLIEPTQGKDGLSSVSVITDVSGGKYSPRSISFRGYKGTELNDEISNLDTSNLTSMGSMFNGCTNLTSVDLSGWDTSNVTSMNSMFYGCEKLTSITFGDNFDTSNVENMGGMFSGCANMANRTGITTLDLSNFNTKKVTSIFQFVVNCYYLTHIDFGENFELPLVTSMQNTFATSSTFDDSTLNAILHICSTAVNCTTKTLRYVTNTAAYDSRVVNLSNYQEFLDAGWTIGY